MSNALSRLRHIFEDELLVRTASGMQSTPRAEALREAIRPVLRQIERVFEVDTSFDPASATRAFSTRLSGLLSLLLLPPLLDRLRRDAPTIALDVIHLPPAQTVDALEKDDIDLAVSMNLEHSSAIRSEVMLHDRMVCMMRRGHPLARQELDLKRFLAYRHLKVSMSATDLRFVDDVLARRQLRRDVALNVPHSLIVPHVLARTDLLSVMRGRLASAIAGKEIVARDLPFASEPFDWKLYWHRRHDGNQAIAWLRNIIREVCSSID
jgi:DNA-binding transcriptional LysR family regulator